MRGAKHQNPRRGTPTEETARKAFSAPFAPRMDPATGYDVRDASEEARAAYAKAVIAALKI